MEHGKIENQIENRLSNYESPVDAEGLWSSLGIEDTPSTNLSNGNRYRIYLLLVPIILGSAMYFFATNNNTYDDSNANNSKSHTSNQTLTVADNDIAQDESVSEQIKTSDKVVNLEVSKEYTNHTQNTNIKNTQSSNYSSRSDSKTNITINTPAQELSNTYNSKANASKQVLAVDKEVAVQQNSVSKQTFASNNHSNTPIQYANTTTNQEDNVPNSIAFANDQNRELLLDGGLRNLDISNMNSIGLMNFPRPVRCPDFGGRKPLRFNLDIHAIPYYSNQLLSLIDDSEANKTWLEQRNSTEKPLEAFQVNVLGRLLTNSGLYVQGGIGYGQIDQKLSVPVKETTSTSNEQGPIIVIIYGNGIPNDTIIGEVPVTTIQRKGAETYNYHRMIEIPIAIGYEKRLNDWGFYIDGGASLNIWTTRKGWMLKDDKPQKYEDIDVFTTSTGVKLNGSLGMKYYFNNDMSLSVGPDIRYHMQNWMKPQYGMTQKHLDLGLRVGLSIPLM